MKRLSHLAAGAAALALLLPAAAVQAQTTSAVVVAACGTPPTTYSAGQNRQVTQDTTGRVCQGATVVFSPSSAASVGIAPIVSASAEACHVFKAGAGNLYTVSGYIGAAGWIMVFDATSAPVDGAVTPKAWVYVPAAGSWGLSYGLVPAVMATGITVCASSTGPLTKTAYSTNTVFSGQVQ